MIWGAVEVAITIVAASIPVLRVLVREVRMATRRRYGYGVESAGAAAAGGSGDMSHKKKKSLTARVEQRLERSNSTIVTVTSGYKRGGRTKSADSFGSSLDDLEGGRRSDSSKLSEQEQEMKRLSDANPGKIVQTQEITVRYFEKDDEDMKRMFDAI